MKTRPTPNQRKRRKTTPLRFYSSKWKKCWLFQNEEDKDLEEEEDEAEDKGPSTHTDVTDADNWVTSVNSVQPQIRPHSEDEVDTEVDAVTAPHHT